VHAKGRHAKAHHGQDAVEERQTPMIARFSTVTGELDAADAESDAPSSTPMKATGTSSATNQLQSTIGEKHGRKGR